MTKHDIKARTSKESKQTSVYLEKQEKLAERYRVEYIKDYVKYCEHCGKEFHVDGRHKNKKYCSEECKIAGITKHEYRINESGEKEYRNHYKCELCNNEFDNWNPRHFVRRFCDDCISKHKSDVFTNKIKTTCGYCGKEIEVIPSRFYSNKYCYCDIKCMAKHYSEIYTGKILILGMVENIIIKEIGLDKLNYVENVMIIVVRFVDVIKKKMIIKI